MTRDSKESVLSRWSRRKHEAELAEPIAEAALPVENEIEQTALAAEAESQPVLTDADMPPIESLNEDSDFSGFMSAGVSDELRNLALRKLFKAPVFNIRDGLDEYDEDYTTFEKLGDIVTADMRHRIEVQEQKQREKLAAEQELEEQQADLDAVEDIDDEDIDDEDELESQSVTVASAEAQVDADQEKEHEQ
ncbi:MAG: DUF3306 domain-containing protein [Gammaproteobacteria bacterium]|nr:DUF3306 domain-containing protein [Gammaproteobacteria bacterium]